MERAAAHSRALGSHLIEPDASMAPPFGGLHVRPEIEFAQK
jgi:hypothetical protein